MKKKACTHPPKRQYSGIAVDCYGEHIWVGCCECGKILGVNTLKPRKQGRGHEKR